MYKCRITNCEIHKDGKFNHWPCGKYDPKIRREMFEKRKKPCLNCGNLRSPNAKLCIKCNAKINPPIKKGTILPIWWRKRISESLRGDRSWNWKGGKTKANKILRSRVEFKDWRKKVFERDNYTCQFCKRIGGELHPDHIKELSKFPELVYNVNNGRTLCKNCHQGRHCINLTTYRPHYLICSWCGVKYKPKSRGTWRSNSKNHFCTMDHRDRFSSKFGNQGQFRKSSEKPHSGAGQSSYAEKA